MKKTLFSLIFVLASFALFGFEVVPLAGKAPPMDGKFDPGDWMGALKLENFSKMDGREPAKEKTVLRFLRDPENLYVAAVLENEDVPALRKKEAADRNMEPWRLNGIEMFFGEKSFSQIVFDYMGRLYKNFDDPLFTKVNHRKDAIVFRCAIPLRLIPRMNVSGKMTKANFYRKSASGVSSWRRNDNRNFLDMTQTGILLFDTPENILSDAASESLRRIDSLEASDCLGHESAAGLKARIGDMKKENRKKMDRDEDLLASLEAFRSLQKEISDAQLLKMKEKYGAQKLPLLTAGHARDSIPEVWRPVKIAGRDYWYMFIMLGIDELEKAGLMEVPLLKNAMFFVRWGQPGVNEFLPPDGKNYKILQKYGNPFAVKTLDQYDIPREKAARPEFKAMFDRAFMEKFYATYGDRFIGFLDDEAFISDTGVFVRSLKHFNLPEPKNRDEAWNAFAKLYRMQSETVPGYAPFRNLANMSAYTREHVGNAAATQLNHLVHRLGDKISGNENGDVMGATAPKVAFARGAARQYGRPWRNYQTYYGWCYLNVPRGGMRCATKSSGPWISSVEKLLTPDCRATAYCHLDGLKVGLGLERQKATFLYPYLGGVGVWNSEADLEEMTSVYDADTIGQVDPLVVNLRDQKLYLSPMAKINAHFYDNIVRKRDRGVSVTPVALVWDRAHGYLPLYFGGRVWDFFNPNELEKTMWALDNHLFRRNKENASYSTSRYGDIFDVITNDAGQNILDAYKVVYPVGDVTLDQPFARRLTEYVRNGGTLVLNAALLKKYGDAFPAGFLGCTLTNETGTSPATYSLIDQTVIPENSPYSYGKVSLSGSAKILAVTTDPAQAPAILANDYGKGRVLVTTPENMKIAGSMNEMLNLFDHLMANVWTHVLEIKVDTPMQYAVNRNKTGWIVYLQNNFGVPPSGGLYLKTYPTTDTSKTADATITIPGSTGKVSKVIDWWTGKEMPFKTTKLFGRGDTILKTTLAGGDCCALEFIME